MEKAVTRPLRASHINMIRDKKGVKKKEEEIASALKKGLLLKFT
jgi:hypothetical protein